MKAEGGRLWQLSGTFRVDMGLADSSGSRACLSQLERRLGYEESERGGVAVQEILAGYRPQLAMSEKPGDGGVAQLLLNEACIVVGGSKSRDPRPLQTVRHPP